MNLHWQSGQMRHVGNWLVSIHFVEGDQPVPDPIGTGFVVGAVGTHRLALTAAHVLDEAIRRIAPERSTADSTRSRAVDALVRDKRVVALIAWDDGRCTQHAISGFASYTSWDAAAFFIESPMEGWPKQLKCVAIDTSVPSVGTEVVIIGFGAMRRGTPYVRNNGEGAQLLLRSPQVRLGRIEQVFLRGHRLAKGPCIGLNIPVTPGMSGCPIFYRSTDSSSPMIACGIASSDISTAEAHESCLVPGDSAGVLVAATLPLKFSMQFGQEMVNKTVQELIFDGSVKERRESSRKWKITYPEPDGVRMQWVKVT